MTSADNTLFYKVFEKTLDQFKHTFAARPPIAPQPSTQQQSTQQQSTQQPSTQQQSTPSIPTAPDVEPNIAKLKTIASKIKGTKLFYMIQRYEAEHIYIYV